MPSVSALGRAALAAAMTLVLGATSAPAQQQPQPKPPAPAAPQAKPAPAPAAPAQAAPAPTTPPAAAVPPPPPEPAMKPPISFTTQILVPGSHFHGVHGLAFNKDDQLFAGSVVGQAIYRINVDSGEVTREVDPPQGMADDIAFGPDGSMAWTAFLEGVVYVRKDREVAKAVATGLPGINSLAFACNVVVTEERRGERVEKVTKRVFDGRLFATQVFLGDALYEIDVKGEKPPRKILENLGGLNGFEFGPDCALYGPLWFKGQVVRIDVEKGTIEKVADGFRTPAAVNFDSKGRLYVVDTALGQLVRVEVATGAKTLIATLKPGLDNLAIDSRDRVFVSSMVDNAIYLVDTETSSWRTIVEGRLAIPSDLAVSSEGGRETLHLADIFSYRTIDGATGAVETPLRMQGDALEYPFGVSVGARHVVMTSWFTGSVQRVDRKTGRSVGILHEFKAPMDAIETDKGDLLVLELGTGSLLRVTGPEGNDRMVVAKDLTAPSAMVAGPNDIVYISDTGAGAIVQIDVASGARRVVIDGLKGPEGIDLGPDGRLYVAEVGTRSVLAIDPRDGAKTVVADELAIGLAAAKGTPPSYVTTGVAVGKSGAVYVSSDIRNAIYKLIPKP